VRYSQRAEPTHGSVRRAAIGRDTAEGRTGGRSQGNGTAGARETLNTVGGAVPRTVGTLGTVLVGQVRAPRRTDAAPASPASAGAGRGGNSVGSAVRPDDSNGPGDISFGPIWSTAGPSSNVITQPRFAAGPCHRRATPPAPAAVEAAHHYEVTAPRTAIVFLSPT
jgi:hypothetical protein